MKFLILVLSFVCACYGQNQTALPNLQDLSRLVNSSFQNLDFNNDTFIERFEFDSFIIIADADNDGCMSKEEYKSFSAGTPDIATKIYEHFDPDNSNCITVDKVAAQYALMDKNHNKQVTLTEFEDYYKQLLQMLLGTGKPVG